MPPSNRAGSHLLVAGGSPSDYRMTGEFRGCAAFDPVAASWRTVPSLNSPREYGCAATIRDTAFKCAGYSGVNFSSDFETLTAAALERSLATPDTARVVERRWDRLSCRPAQRRAGARLVALEQRLFLCGGYNGEYLSSMEVRASRSPAALTAR